MEGRDASREAVGFDAASSGPVVSTRQRINNAEPDDRERDPELADSRQCDPRNREVYSDVAWG